MFKHLIASAVLAASISSQADATTYQYKVDESALNGVYEATFTYRDTDEMFQMSFETLNSADVDGFWVVVNDGPQPYGQGQGHLAILYSDLNHVWAYQYTGRGVRGVNGSTDGVFLQKFTNAVQSSTDGTRSLYNMVLDMSGVNAANPTIDVIDPNTGQPYVWEGVQFDEKIGTWLHPTQDTFDNTTCNNDYMDGDELTCFRGNNWIGWDKYNQDTTVLTDPEFPGPPVVPLPAAGWMLLAGIAGLFGMRRAAS